MATRPKTDKVLKSMIMVVEGLTEDSRLKNVCEKIVAAAGALGKRMRKFGGREG